MTNLTLISFKEELLKSMKDEMSKEFKSMKNEMMSNLTLELKPIKDELSGLKNNIGTLNDKFERYIKKEGDGIEYEINKNVKHFLQQKYKGTIIKQLPIKNLKNYSNSEDTNLNNLISTNLTEFDGIFSIDYRNPLKKNELIIVEAKHNVSIDQINEKIYQLFFFKKILEISKSDIDIVSDKKFNNFVKSFKLKNTSNNFYFFIGGPTWDDNAIEYLQKINTGKLEKINWKNKSGIFLNIVDEKDILNHIKGHIGIIAPNGTRYNLYDNINYIDELLDSDDILYSGHQIYKSLHKRSLLLKEQEPLKKIEEERDSEVIYGGNIYNGLEMKILPNYLNIKYI